jgi:hypothetical protein
MIDRMRFYRSSGGGMIRFIVLLLLSLLFGWWAVVRAVDRCLSGAGSVYNQYDVDSGTVK